MAMVKWKRGRVQNELVAIDDERKKAAHRRSSMELIPVDPSNTQASLRLL